MSNIFSLRKALASDARTVFHWRNDPSIVAKGFLQRPVGWDEHATWFTDLIKSDTRLMFILEQNEDPVGQMRFDLESDVSAEISIYMAPGHEGQGLGVAGMRKGCLEVFSQWAIDHVVARVRQDNEPAKLAFAKAGFRLQSETVNYDIVEYLLDRPVDVPHNRLTFGAEEVGAVSNAVASGQWAEGPSVNELEAMLADVTGRRTAVCVGSGLSALKLSLLALGVGSGDEVIIPGYSCVALANAVLSIGATPRPADVTAGDGNLAPDHVAEHFSLKTRAIIAVHTFGQPAEINNIMRFGVPVIEDCAHALGIRHNGRPIGSLGNVSITSFYATKLIGSGAGGAVILDDPQQEAYVRQMRDYVDQPACGLRANDKMTNIDAALGLAQLRRMDAMLVARYRLAERYLEILGELHNRTGGFNLPENNGPRIWYRFVVGMTSKSAGEIIDTMRAYGVKADKPVHCWLSPEQLRDRPGVSAAFDCFVSLPLYPTLTEEEQDRVCHAFEHATIRVK
ncbi:MAG: GNAT family N-acetyltransferase [Proteobacteria bacterium]|nr:GNAT family N-acetyltransferase [Pseudomonadota bacterium]